MAFTPTEPGTLLVDERRFVLRGEPGVRWLQVQRIRVGVDEAAEAVAVARDAMARVGATIGSWWLTDAATPALERRLLAAGLAVVEDDYLIDGLALAHEPPPGPPDVEARAIGGAAELAAATEVATEAFGTQIARSDPETRWAQLRASRVERVYAAWVDGRLAATGRSYFSSRGVMLAGGSTAPWARGRGAYRALVRARWDDAAARGTPLLGVHAKPATSSPILRGLGFEQVLRLRRLEDVPSGDGD